MNFLKAEWRKLAIANYEVEPSLLKKYLPNNTELDIWEGKCFVSLVGFMFKNTRLLGIPIPFHRHFEEVNLRFYVRYCDKGEWKRGVVFIKEIVPKPALTFVANHIYKEHYQTMKMSHILEQQSDQLRVEYTWKAGLHQHRLRVNASSHPVEIPENSVTEFITEHYWGYTKVTEKCTFEYEVVHPRWLAYEVLDHGIDVDFETVYGNDFKMLSKRLPSSVMLAEGSEIVVKSKRKI
ncbi:YqjF family protein [Reichenbachiella sp.]|uniref:YqjF family protein n=1 Tax=Reichenbachiella sp. TaxID=2184521 RepID=UPI003BAFACCA